ncbi:MAG: NifU family protein, partial [Fimbriimonas ginsengisoli]|nr:NifU family protein [Fimbriimonas ginsengisoli]
MPSYVYLARDRAGKQIAGSVSGQDERSVREQLRRKDLFVTTLTVQKQAAVPGGGAFRKKKVSLNDMVVMSRQLATLVKAGLPLVESLSAYVETYHGGALEMVSFDGATLKIRLLRACVGCKLSAVTLHGWV